jgi:hypothetical protein
MSQTTIFLPVKTDLPSILSFARDLDKYAKQDRLIVHFGKERFFSPFSLLFIASKFLALRAKNSTQRWEPKGHGEHTYLAHIGFFHMCGFDFGREMGEASGNDNYLPITRLARESFYVSEADKYQALQSLIERRAKQLALVIARDEQNNKNLFDALSYSIREVMRDVFEHSKARNLYYCAQYWPKSSKVEFAIADFGIGIRRGLSENPNFRFDADKQAIEYSLLPSVSGKTHVPRWSDEWHNSGYGLYMTHRLARNGGNFVLGSGDTAIQLSRKTKNNFQTSFSGTILRSADRRKRCRLDVPAKTGGKVHAMETWYHASIA